MTEMIRTEIEAYANDHTTGESADVRALVDAADHDLDFIDMLSGRVVGRLLAMLIKMSAARRVLEIGTFAGYASLLMAEALPDDGELITCEYNRRYESLARTGFGNSPHGHKIDLRMGPADETIATLSGPFDLIFLDADKAQYPQYYDRLLPLLPGGGILVIDNVLWEGSVLHPNTRKAEAIDRLNATIAADEQVEQVMLTVRDGVTIVRKR